MRRSLKSFTLLAGMVASCAVNAQQWEATGGPKTGIWVNALAMCGNNLIAAINGGIYRTSDNGTTWVDVNRDASMKALKFQSLVVNGSTVFAGSNGGVFRSTDSGVTWNSLLVSSTLKTPALSFAINGTKIFAGTENITGTTYGGVFLSINNGTSWAPAGLSSQSVRTIAVLGNTVFAGTNRVYSTIDNGSVWIEKHHGLSTTSSISTMGTFENKLYAAWYTNGLYVSEDSGNTWIAANNGLTNATVKSLAFVGGKIVAGTNMGVFVSFDEGGSWASISDGITIKSVNTLAIGSSYLFTGTNEGIVYKLDISKLPVHTTFRHHPGSRNFALSTHQNALEITYTLSSTKMVKLSVHSISGRVVSITPKKLQPSGTHRTVFKTDPLSPGLYTIRFEDGKNIECKSILIVR